MPNLSIATDLIILKICVLLKQAPNAYLSLKTRPETFSILEYNNNNTGSNSLSLSLPLSLFFLDKSDL